MPADLRQQLREAAVEAPADLDAIGRRAEVLRRRRLVGAALAVVAVPLLVVAALRVDVAPTLSLEPAGGGGAGTVLSLPEPGEVRPDLLSDGTPVWVAHDADGTVHVVEAYDPHEIAGVRVLVGWCPTSQLLEELPYGSRFDRAGRWLGGPAPADLATYDVEVLDGAAVVGGRAEPQGRSDSPVTPAGPACDGWPAWADGDGDRGEGAGALVAHLADQPAVAPEEALQRPDGTRLLVEGAVERRGLAEPVVCAPADRDPGNPVQCPQGGHPVDVVGPDAEEDHGDPDTSSGLRGRFLATVAGGRFTDLVAMADAWWYGGSFQGEWVLTGPLSVLPDPDIEGWGDLGDAGEPWLLVHDDPDGHGDWTAFAPADDLVVFGRTALAGTDEPSPMRSPGDLEAAVRAGILDGVAFEVTLRKTDGLAIRIEELP